MKLKTQSYTLTPRWLKKLTGKNPDEFQSAAIAFDGSDWEWTDHFRNYIVAIIGQNLDHPLGSLPDKIRAMEAVIDYVSSIEYVDDYENEEYWENKELLERIANFYRDPEKFLFEIEVSFAGVIQYGTAFFEIEKNGDTTRYFAWKLS